ncbi:hypothetical protein OIU13_06445 [Brevundimonas sp. BT-123]|uniref:hypothetical protein n=1 Tax=Brevundimonas sp. BT-123 TaxID=2986928 RepID=UPI002235C525|nr:hypothetical protein [Brevundimonas sp. BT-123]MCW0046175.1 hypothetical protein [Brevundimonas sp. BT-123]
MKHLASTFFAVAMSTAGLSHAAFAAAQTGDDWEFAEDAARNLSVAAVRFDGGQAIIVQCGAGELKVALQGLPERTGPSHRVRAERADGMTDVQTWDVAAGRTWFSAAPARDARFLRAGGVLKLRSDAGQASPVSATFELPTEHDNVDRVLTACGYTLTNDRDTLARAPMMQAVVSSDAGSTAGAPGRSMEVSCIVRSGIYRDCRVDHRMQAQTEASARREAARWNGTRAHTGDASANEGRVAYLYVPLLMVVQR